MYLLVEAGTQIPAPARKVDGFKPCIVDSVQGFNLKALMPEIPLTKGKVAIVDEIDFEYLSQWKWKCTSHGYAARAVRKGEGERGRQVYMHRVVARPLEDQEVDHRNCNKLDNRRSNLRICSESENKRNRTAHRNNKLGLKGVSLHSSKTCYMARIMKDRKLVHLGYFKTPEEAHKAYTEASKTLHGDFSRN